MRHKCLVLVVMVLMMVVGVVSCKVDKTEKVDSGIGTGNGTESDAESDTVPFVEIIGEISEVEKTLFGDSAAVCVVRKSQNGYNIEIIHNSEVDLIHLKRGDSISRYFVIDELPMKMQCALASDSTGVFRVNMNIPVFKGETLRYSHKTLMPELFFLDVDFDGEEEFVAVSQGYNRCYYTCFNLVRGNYQYDRGKGFLEPMNEPPYNNLVASDWTQPESYTVFNRKKKSIYVYEVMGCTSIEETWAEFVTKDEWSEPEMTVVKKHVRTFCADGSEYLEVSKLVNDTLKVVKDVMVKPARTTP